MEVKPTKRRYQFGMFLALALAAVGVVQASELADKPMQSAHRPGAHGLEGWTLNSPVPGSGYGDERFAFTLVIARHGHIIRRITGEPIIWSWMFWANGQDVAYETGPFHFSLNCLLIRLSDGRKLESYDCYHDQPPTKPRLGQGFGGQSATDLELNIPPGRKHTDSVGAGAQIKIMEDQMKKRTGEPWIPAPSYGALLPQFSVNLVVRDIDRAVLFYQRVLLASVHYKDPDFAALRILGAEFMLHADHTYEANPWSPSLKGGARRGLGAELRLLGMDPDELAIRARESNSLFADVSVRGHGWREVMVQDPDGYVWAVGWETVATSRG